MRTLIAACLLAVSACALAQAFPSRPVRFISPFPPGGAVDIITRITATGLQEALGQPVVVENRSGAGGTVGADAAARAPADGYTLFSGGIATHGIAPALYSKLGYDAVRDFSPLSMIGTTPNVLIVNPSVQARSVGEFIALAKAAQRKLDYGSPGIGTSPQLSMELFKLMSGIELVHIPYKGNAPAIADLLGGQLPVMFDNLPGAMGHIKAGRVRVLGVSSVVRHPSLPDVPTIAESGLPGFEVVVWYAVFAAGTPPPQVLASLTAAANRAVSSPEVQKKLSDAGVDPGASSPDDLAMRVRTEMAKWAKVVKDAGLPVQ
ncbi:MAG TPA: tripartite tricarboxylate transporter substrate binding protein [Burkholderiales bacterium]|jgi:tripartite-type tricarboxylate transporter receptor subunit TctC|nr:tripartite tricarboxylate transporter substrate binding protein [Burkholderiales bacterium]